MIGNTEFYAVLAGYPLLYLVDMIPWNGAPVARRSDLRRRANPSWCAKKLEWSSKCRKKPSLPSRSSRLLPPAPSSPSRLRSRSRSSLFRPASTDTRLGRAGQPAPFTTCRLVCASGVAQSPGIDVRPGESSDCLRSGAFATPLLRSRPSHSLPSQSCLAPLALRSAKPLPSRDCSGSRFPASLWKNRRSARISSAKQAGPRSTEKSPEFRRSSARNHRPAMKTATTGPFRPDNRLGQPADIGPALFSQGGGPC